MIIPLSTSVTMHRCLWRSPQQRAMVMPLLHIIVCITTLNVYSEGESAFLTGLSVPGCRLLALPPHPLLMYSYEGRLVPPQSVSAVVVPHGSVLSARCRQPGLYRQDGGTHYNCSHGEWRGNVTCSDTNHAYNYTSGSAFPAIVWHVAPGGVAEVTERGEVMLLPGAILHLDCLFPRLEGNPTWTWTPEYRKYPTGWSISTSERELHYRLSVYYAKGYDSGAFTCTTPRGQNNSITLDVRAVTCSALSVPYSVPEEELYNSGMGAQAVDGMGRRALLGDGRVITSGSGTMLGATRHFRCSEGYLLDGPDAMKCLSSGVWSWDRPPSCHVVRCPSLAPLPPLLRLRHMSVSAGGTALFSCPQSYTLTGPSSLLCRSNGTWSGLPPHCEDVQCSPPVAPLHGSVSVPPLRRVGDVAVYSCDVAHVLQGARLVACANDGRWARPTPLCVVSCPSPGQPTHGRVSPRLSHYRLSSVLLVSCAPGYRPAGPDRLKCLQTGRWSSPLPPCVPSLAG